MTEEKLAEIFNQFWGYVVQSLSEPQVLVQIGAIIIGYGLAHIVTPKIQHSLDELQKKISGAFFLKIADAVFSVTRPAIWLIIQFLVLAGIQGAGHPSSILSVTCSLLSAWVVIHIFTRLMQNTTWARLVALCVWVIAALNIVGLLTPTLEFLDSLAFSFGDTQISMVLWQVLLFSGSVWGFPALPKPASTNPKP
jgi:hypothetical protein